MGKNGWKEIIGQSPGSETGISTRKQLGMKCEAFF